MTDLLLQLGTNPTARRVVRTLGLPIPLPQPLRRETGPAGEKPLSGRRIALGCVGVSSLPLRMMLAEAGATLAESSEGAVDAAVLDATALDAIDRLGDLYAFFHPIVARLSRCGRIAVVGRTVEGSPQEAAAQGALDGFVRSLAKEIGRAGATANLVRVERGAEDRLRPVLRFVLSARSAFVSGQPITVDARARSMGEPALVRTLVGKTALVTGAARGIGEATARVLAQEGAHVVLLDRPQDEVALGKLARSLGGSVAPVDLAETGAQARIVAALGPHGGVDVLVHNAGITRDKTLARMRPEQWNGVLDVNLGAVARITDALEPLIRDGGRIVCLSSIAGLAGNVGQTAYAASKAGIVGWVRAQAERFAARGVTVNAIAPGFIETRLTAAIPLAIREVARRLSALGQGGLPDDVAQAISFLASPGAQGITGRTLRVCGGAFVGA